MREKSEPWIKYNIRTLIKNGVFEIGDGYRAKNTEFDSKGLPFARAGNIKSGFHFVGADLLCEKSVIRAKEKVSMVNDSVITTKGTFGRVAFVQSDTLHFVYSPQLCYWRVKDKSFPDYV